MFVLAELRDTVIINPKFFNDKLSKSIMITLNKKFANKVVHDVGLCIALWDITNIEESFIFPGNGSSHTIVDFRYVVFRSFVDEILVGKIKSCSPEGVHVTMGFFDDILIPADSLPNPSRFSEADQVWVWEYRSEDGTPHDMPLEQGEEIRFKVIEETFIDTTPTSPEQAEVLNVADKQSPYTLLGSISESGLGRTCWWS